MDSITSRAMLHQAIAVLEVRQREQERDLKERFLLISENLTPFNILKSVIRSVVGSPEMQHGIINAAVTIASGYLSRKLLFRPPMGLAKKIVGGLVQLGASSLLGISLFRKPHAQ